MPDDFTQLNSGLGGDFMDESGVLYPDEPEIRKRARVVIGGEQKDQIVPVTNTPPPENAYGLVARIVRPAATFPGIQINEYNTVSLVPAGTEQTVSTFVVPSTYNFYPIGFWASGQVNAKFILYVNEQVKLVVRSSVANLNAQSDFLGATPKLLPNSVVRVAVIHESDGVLPQFDATILGYCTLIPT